MHVASTLRTASNFRVKFGRMQEVQICRLEYYLCLRGRTVLGSQNCLVFIFLPWHWIYTLIVFEAKAILQRARKTEVLSPSNLTVPNSSSVQTARTVVTKFKQNLDNPYSYVESVDRQPRHPIKQPRHLPKTVWYTRHKWCFVSSQIVQVNRQTNIRTNYVNSQIVHAFGKTSLYSQKKSKKPSRLNSETRPVKREIRQSRQTDIQSSQLYGPISRKDSRETWEDFQIHYAQASQPEGQ